jgi:esterase/lipase
MIQKESNISFTRYIPSIKRHRDKLEKLKETNPKATLADVVKPYQIYYTAKNHM